MTNIEQLLAQIGQLSAQVDTQALTIERYQREDLRKGRIIEAKDRRIEWLEAELKRQKNRKPTPREIAEAVCGGKDGH